MTIVIDFSSPLVPGPLDVRGNAQHWFIRTAEAANDTTFFGFTGKFASPEDWENFCAIPANNAWVSYLKNTGLTRHGVSLAQAKAKHDRRMRGAFEKALTNWTYAF